MELAFDAMWDALAPVGRDRRSGGYSRFAWTREDATLREWFGAQAQARALDLTTDRAANLWAWWGDPDAQGPGIVVGSHLDSVPDGGAFDGPLGVVAGFAAIDELRSRDWTPRRPVAVACFGDEEGARFGLACAGSRLLTGALDPDRARGLRDDEGVTMAEAMGASGVAPAGVGADPTALARVGIFLELHVEQGRALVEVGSAVGVARSIWPHGRWRLDLTGRADHAGTTRLQDRDDPMLDLAAAVLAARSAAQRHGALATVGKVRVAPNGVNAVPSHVTAWLDARGPREATVQDVVADVAASVPRGRLTQESWTGLTAFDAGLRERLSGLLGADGQPAPVLATGAGHDAGVLAAAGVDAGMLFVRNPTGVSHSPAEHAERDDCLAGVRALASTVAELAGEPAP